MLQQVLEPFKRPEDVCNVPCAYRVQLGPRGDTCAQTIRRGSIASDASRDVRAVTTSGICVGALHVDDVGLPLAVVAKVVLVIVAVGVGVRVSLAIEPSDPDLDVAMHLVRQVGMGLVGSRVDDTDHHSGAVYP